MFFILSLMDEDGRFLIKDLKRSLAHQFSSKSPRPLLFGFLFTHSDFEFLAFEPCAIEFADYGVGVL